MLVHKKNNEITFKLNKVSIISRQMCTLEKMFQNVDITVHYEQNMENYIAMDDINLYINIDDNDNNYELTDKQVTSLIDIIYLKLCANQLYIIDLQSKKKYYVTNDNSVFTIPIKQTFFEYVVNLVK